MQYGTRKVLFGTECHPLFGGFLQKTIIELGFCMTYKKSQRPLSAKRLYIIVIRIQWLFKIIIIVIIVVFIIVITNYGCSKYVNNPMQRQ